MASQRVEFRTRDNVALRGDFYSSGVEGGPVIVMTQGLTLLKEHYLQCYAARFTAAGISCLVYDHRGWGSSDPQDSSSPQWHHVDPMQQAQDYHDAVLFAQTLPSVDPVRIAIWGIGHSGAASMIAAGSDPNIKAVILDMPVLSGSKDAKLWPPGLLEKAYEERRQLCADPDTKQSYVHVWNNSDEETKGPRGELLLHGDQPYGFIKEAVRRSTAAGTPWSNQMTLQSLVDIARVEPSDFIHKIAPRKLLHVVAPVVPLTGTVEDHLKAHEKAHEPKQLVVTTESHLENYFGGFDEHLKYQVDWAKDNI